MQEQSWLAFDPVRGYYISRWPSLPPQARTALAALRVPGGAQWERLLMWWVVTPSGLFANFATGFIGTAYLGIYFFPLWLLAGVFTPAAVVYARGK